MTPKYFYKLLLFLIATSFIIAAFIYARFWKELDSLSKKVSESQAVLASFSDKERSLESLKQNYEKIKADSGKIDEALPSEKQAAPLMASIENLALQKGVSVAVYQHKLIASKKASTNNTDASAAENKAEPKTSDLSLSQTEKEGELYRMPLEVTVGGSYVKVLEFLKDLENLNRALVINKTTITKEKGAPTDPEDLVTGVFSISAYLKR